MISDEFAQFIWEHTAGLPLLVEEVLALLRTRGLIVNRDGVWSRRPIEQLEVPRGVRDSTLERVSRLPSGARRLAEAMAVLQVPVALPVLLTVAGDQDLAAGVDDEGIAELHGHSGRVLMVGFTADPDIIVSAAADGTIRLWSLTVHKQLAQIRVGASLHTAALDPSEGVVLAARAGGSIAIRIPAVSDTE